jgi:peptidyl-prolyl cis-trans isomerase SurA
LHKLFITAVMALIIVMPSGVYSAEVVDRIVAVVNGSIITLAELNKNVAAVLRASNKELDAQGNSPEVAKLRDEILEKMINDILLRQKAEEYQIEVSEAEIKTYIESLKEQNNINDEELTAYLAAQGLTRATFEDNIRGNLLRSRILSVLVNRKIVITDEQVREYYEANKDSLARTSGMRLSVLVLPDDVDAEEVRARIASGEVSFAQAAREMSVGPAAEQGGDLGEVTLSDLAPELRDVASGLEPGQVSQPFPLQGKTSLIILQGGGAASGPPPLEEVQDQIRAKLMEPMQEQMFAELAERLRENAIVDIRL